MEERAGQKGKKGKGIHSMKVAIWALVFVSITLANVMNLTSIIPMAKNNLTEVNKNYIMDLTNTSGNVLELLYASMGEGMYESSMLEMLIGDTGVEGVESSYAYLVDDDGTMMYHPSADKIGQPVENSVVLDLIQQISRGVVPEPAVIDYEFSGTTKFAGYYVGKTEHFILVVTADRDEILAPVDEMEVQGTYSALLSMVVCVIVAIIGAWILLRPITMITGLVAKLADLDFTKQEIQEKLDRRKDETGDMSRAIGGLRDKLAEVVENLQNQSTQLMASAVGMEKNTEETIKAAAQVEQAVHDIAQGATSQAGETQTATENVVRIGQMIDTTTQDVNQLNDTTNNVAASSNEANRILKELSEINKQAIESVDAIYEQTNTTNASALKIREATALISSIAEETNLLSLNASIEAARAGEAGAGFAVVAAQIQKLAEQSNQSASQIEQIINTLLTDSSQAVETMDEVKKIMVEQSDKVEGVSQTFEKVTTEVDSSIQGISHIAESAKEMLVARNNVVDVVQNLTAIAEENAASTEETSASVTEISAVIADIADNAGGLKNIAEELDRTTKQFKL